MLNINLINKCCPLSDDIWLKIMELMNNYKVVKVDFRCKQWLKLNSSQKKHCLKLIYIKI